MRKEIKKIETFDVDEKMDELAAATITVMSRLNELAHYWAGDWDVTIVKSVMGCLKKSGIDLDDDEYCLDMDQLNSSIDREINRLNSLCVVHPEVEIIRDQLRNIRILLHEIVAYYAEPDIDT